MKLHKVRVPFLEFSNRFVVVDSLHCDYEVPSAILLLLRGYADLDCRLFLQKLEALLRS